MFLHNCAIPKEFLHQVLYLEYIYVCVCVCGGGGGGGEGKKIGKLNKNLKKKIRNNFLGDLKMGLCV